VIRVTTLFDSYIAVDWSASNKPTSGKDSIWSCVGDDQGESLQTANHRTRRAAEAWLLEWLTAAVHAGQRVLVGLDFPYGYPAGLAVALKLQGEPWRAVWTYLECHIVDDGLNVSNRFEVAARINQELGRRAPFWGRPENLMLPSLPFGKEVAYHAPEPGGLSEWRQAEQQLQRLKMWPQSVWKLAGAGAVGSQSLVGIPVVARLRDHEPLRDVSRVWPFEAHVPDLPAGSPAVLHAEIWPTIVPFADEPGSCRDEQQVRAVVRHWRELDRAGHLGNLFAAAPDNEAVQHEEGWVLGAPAPGTPITVPPRPPRRAAPTLEQGKPSATAASTPTSSPRQPCLCGCGNFPRGNHSRFMPGHDQRINPATGRRFNAH
jgi:precorrin-8X/cobalt-precorrin-8 methylmutase